MKLTNEQMLTAIIKTNRRLLYKVFTRLRHEKILNRATLRIGDRSHAALFLREKNLTGGCYVMTCDYYGVKRRFDVAIGFIGANGRKQTRFVAMQILEALRSFGLAAEWEGSLRKKILVDMSSPIWEQKAA